MAPDMMIPTSEKIAPPSAPMMTDAPPSLLDPPDDDIPDVAVPAATVAAITAKLPPPADRFAEHEALLQGFLQVVQRYLKEMINEQQQDLKSRLGAVDLEHLALCRTLEQIAKVAQQQLGTLAQANEHSQYQLSDALLKLQEQGLALRHDPYTVRVHAVAPQGYAVEIQVAKGTVEELVDALPKLTTWLAEQYYKPAIN